MNKNHIQPEEISSILRKQLSLSEVKETDVYDYGTVLKVGDGIARVYGLKKIQAGELIVFPESLEEDGNPIYGLALNLEEDNVGVVIFGTSYIIKEGQPARRTNDIVSIEVGNGLLGRVIDALGKSLDGKGAIKGKLIRLPLERKAPGVIYRHPVCEPLQTGIKAIDALIPIGLGQRELIIGDRQTGKTSIIIDTILNQKRTQNTNKPIHCIYVAIGQKGSSVASIVRILEDHGAMEYTTIVLAPASATAPLRYIAPFAGATIGEYFRDTGRHALVIYDDLSKQAVAYRELSLLLRRPPGREAYPGDVFYLHSRLLERAAKIIDDDKVAAQMNNIPDPLKGIVKGGGSLTALPVIETQAGDVSAYIPTNVISITDGQIFLNTDLFNSGLRPAIDVGISVSRVGGAAQVKAMKKLAGNLKLSLAQYRELEAFSKFGSDLDAVTQKQLAQGERTVEMLKQAVFNPLSVALQISLLKVNNEGLLEKILPSDISTFEQLFFEQLETQYDQKLTMLEKDGVLDDNFSEKLLNVARKIIEGMGKEHL